MDKKRMNRLLNRTPNKRKMKTTLKYDKLKGVGLFATKHIEEDEIIAFYPIDVHLVSKYESPSDGTYQFSVYNKRGNHLESYIGDFDIDNIPLPSNNIPFWGAFANEPSVGESVNSEIVMNLKNNYKNRNRVKNNDKLIYVLVATKDIFPGEEILWYYGKNYDRDYKVGKTE